MTAGFVDVHVHTPDGKDIVYEVERGHAAFAEDFPLPVSLVKRFYLLRTKDISGVSGTGVVADGVQFPGGDVVMAWRVEEKPGCISTWKSIEDVRTIHGHEGSTEIVWCD